MDPPEKIITSFTHFRSSLISVNEDNAVLGFT